jgi:large subunit ribosomal protein L25
VGTAPAEDDKGAVIVQLISEVDVEALPADLPDKLELDITSLKDFGDNLTLKDIKLDSSKLEIQADLEQQVVQAQEPKEEEPEPTPEPEEGEAEKAEGEAPATDGEAPKEGESKPEADSKPEPKAE